MEIMYHSTIKYGTQMYAFWLTWSEVSFKAVVAGKWSTVELRKWLDMKSRCTSPVGHFHHASGAAELRWAFGDDEHPLTCRRNA